MLDDTRGFNPYFTLRSGGVINPSPGLTLVKFLSHHFFWTDTYLIKYFLEKKIVWPKVFLPEIFYQLFWQKNSFNKIFDQNLEEKIFVSKTFVDKKFVFTKSASEGLAVSLTDLLA